MNTDTAADGSVDWAAHAARPADAASLLALAGVSRGSLSGPELVDAVLASEKALSLLTGVQMRLLAELAVPFVAGDPMRLAARLARKSCITRDDSPEQVEKFVPAAAASLAAAEVAAALRISPVTAGVRVRESDTMTTVLAPTLDALEAGVLDRGKARVIAEQCGPLSEENAEQVQDLVLPGAGVLSTSELRDVTGQAVIVVDPAGAQDRHDKAAARRELAFQALPDAMATLKAFLPADGAVKIFQVSDLLATGTAGMPGDDRGIGARRVDALVDIADQLLTYGHLDLSDYLGRELADHGNFRQSDRHVPDTSTDTDITTKATEDTCDKAGNCEEPAENDSNVNEAELDSDLSQAGSRTVEPGSTDSDGDTGVTVMGRETTEPGPSAPEATEVGSVSVEPGQPALVATEVVSVSVEPGPPAAAGVTELVSETSEPGEAAAETSAPADMPEADGPVETADFSDPAGRTLNASGGAVTERCGGLDGNGDGPTDSGSTNTGIARADGADRTLGSANAGAAVSRSVATSPRSKSKGKKSDGTFTRQGRRPHLSVTLGLGTLAGLDEFPGTLAGFGAIPAGLARSIAKSAATITALLADPDTGSVSQAGALTYRPRQDLRDQIAALLDICQFPSCRQPTWRCDIDHREPFDHQHPADGGETSLDNNGPLCRRHHLFKHHTEWRCRPDPDRTVMHWTSPTGHRYTKRGRQAVPPELWVSTAGTAVAERLDALVAFTSVAHPSPADSNNSGQPRAGTGRVEELLVALLLQNQLNKPSFEYHHEEGAWGADMTNDPSSQDADASERTCGDHDDDAPPF